MCVIFGAVKKAVEEAGEIDVLVCNQGVFVPGELETQEMEEVKCMIDVNLGGTFHLIKAALPGMKNRKDREPASIAIMSSQAGQVMYDAVTYNHSSVAGPRSYLMAFVEVNAAGILRIAALCFQWNWYGSIEKWHAQK
ncbi:hypothetical protein RJ639_035349 [Escallonia herrerae]|uniref:Uncharacterized protein n=1 Tax=Escallonia herrerae TaxID=1293975 RepID=A0AA88WPQ2_9ASTE|nr:hypothetical protein RJ639_035349 [Escallonia herrerae]